MLPFRKRLRQDRLHRSDFQKWDLGIVTSSSLINKNCNSFNQLLPFDQFLQLKSARFPNFFDFGGQYGC